MVGVVGIVPGKSWLLRRLLSLQRILALVQYLLYAVWCTERTAYPYALCGETANFVVSCWKIPIYQGDGWSHPAKTSSNKRRLMIWKHFVKGFEGCVGWMDPTDRSLCFIYERSGCEMNLEKHNIIWCLCVLFSDYDFCYTWLCSWILIPRSVRPSCSRFGA